MFIVHVHVHVKPEWRDAVAPMMAEPRSSVKYNAVFPESLS